MRPLNNLKWSGIHTLCKMANHKSSVTQEKKERDGKKKRAKLKKVKLKSAAWDVIDPRWESGSEKKRIIILFTQLLSEDWF